MLDIYEEVEERIDDVVVCNKSTVEGMMRELEEGRKDALWIPLDSTTKPAQVENGLSGDVLIHLEHPDGKAAVTTGRYEHASNQWRLNGEASGGAAKIVGWRYFPVPQYSK